MTDDQLAKAQRVIAKCESALETCQNRTPGVWTANITGEVLWSDEEICKCRRVLYNSPDAAFVALASRMTELTLRSTAIGLRALIEVDYVRQAMGASGHDFFIGPSQLAFPLLCNARERLTAILDAWPDL